MICFFKCKREQRQKTHAGSLFSFQLFVFLFTVQFTACQCNVAHIIPMYSYIINFSKWHLANKAKEKNRTQIAEKKLEIDGEKRETSVTLVISSDCYLHPAGSIIMSQTSTSMPIISSGIRNIYRTLAFMADALNFE